MLVMRHKHSRNCHVTVGTSKTYDLFQLCLCFSGSVHENIIKSKLCNDVECYIDWNLRDTFDVNQLQAEVSI